jgi:hypothetical protein
MKICYKCKQEKQLHEFYKDKSKKDGLSGLCKSCSYLKNKEYNEAHKEKGKEYEIQQKQKSFVIQYIDKDNNGLNIQEDYQIKELMDIQDSSKTYVPTFKDWERAYNKIK